LLHESWIAVRGAGSIPEHKGELFKSGGKRDMSYTEKAAILMLVLAMAGGGAASAQGPLHKQVNYTINVPYALRKANYMLPAGKYILYQVNQNDLNLFALYQGDMMHSPIAMLRTTRIYYQATGYPEETRMLIGIDESSADAHPVLRGWNIPGDDGWEIIGVVPKNLRVLSQAQYADARRKSRLRRAAGHLNPKRWIPHRRKISRASTQCCSENE
jgi:hypothetical protein